MKITALRCHTLDYRWTLRASAGEGMNAGSHSVLRSCFKIWLNFHHSYECQINQQRGNRAASKNNDGFCVCLFYSGEHVFWGETGRGSDKNVYLLLQQILVFTA